MYNSATYNQIIYNGMVYGGTPTPPVNPSGSVPNTIDVGINSVVIDLEAKSNIINIDNNTRVIDLGVNDE